LALKRVESKRSKYRFHGDFTPRAPAVSRPKFASRGSLRAVTASAVTELEEMTMSIRFNLRDSARQAVLAFSLVAAASALPLPPAAKAQTLASRSPVEAAIVDVVPQPATPAQGPILFPRFGYLEFDEMVPEGATDADLYGEPPAEHRMASTEYSE
jgi:hypothetical protein